MENSETNVKALERALKILDCFTRENPRLSLVEIAQKVGLSPSTTTRMIGTLQNNGYLDRDPLTLQYRLGYRLANLGAVCLEGCELREIARPYLVKIRDRYNESVGLYVISRSQRVCIDCVHSTQPLHRVIEIGSRMEMTRGAAGKLLLAYQTEEEIQRFLLLDSFVTKKELAEIRQAGYAVSVNEHEQGLTAIAAPIFNAEHTIEAALSVSGPCTRIDAALCSEIAEYIIGMAGEISEKLGF